MNLLFVKLRRGGKEIRASFAVAPQTAKIMSTVHKCSVKLEKALNLWVEDINRNILIDNSFHW